MVQVSWRFLVIWLVMTSAALWLDQPLAGWLHDSGISFLTKDSTVSRIIKLPGTVGFLLVLIVFRRLCPPRYSGESLLLVTTAATSGLFYSVAKWAVGRSRPMSNGLFNNHAFQIHPFDGGFVRLFVAKPAESFPSGHASLAFAMATVLAVYFPQGRPFFFGIAVLVAVERVLEDAHYLSDVLAGAGLGIIAACCAAALLRRYLTKQTLPTSINGKHHANAT
jgi:membrane-associated phospholipid phosphatase